MPEGVRFLPTRWSSPTPIVAFDRSPDDYLCTPLVQLRLLDWAHAIARRYLYEQADRERIEALMRSDDPELAGLAAKIDREEAYHRMHAELWADRLRDEPRFRQALDELQPYVGGERGTHTPEFAELWNEMTSVRRSAPGAEW